MSEIPEDIQKAAAKCFYLHGNTQETLTAAISRALLAERQSQAARIAELEALLQEAGEAARDVLAERERQKAVEGWTPEHDDEHETGELATAARAYVAHATNYAGHIDAGYRTQEPPSYWPWARGWWKPKDRRRDLVKAGALILAEIERLDRAAARALAEKLRAGA